MKIIPRQFENAFCILFKYICNVVKHALVRIRTHGGTVVGGEGSKACVAVFAPRFQAAICLGSGIVAEGGGSFFCKCMGPDGAFVQYYSDKGSWFPQNLLPPLGRGGAGLN